MVLSSLGYTHVFPGAIGTRHRTLFHYTSRDIKYLFVDESVRLSYDSPCRPYISGHTLPPISLIFFYLSLSLDRSGALEYTHLNLLEPRKNTLDMANIKITPPAHHTSALKTGRKRRANGHLKSEVSLNFRDSMYSEKAAAMIESSRFSQHSTTTPPRRQQPPESEVTYSSSPATAAPTAELAAGAFQFVDQSASSRREARRFVMRRSVWHRKQEQTKRLHPDTDSRSRTSPSSLRAKSGSLSEPSSPLEGEQLEVLPPKLTLDTKSRSYVSFFFFTSSLSITATTIFMSPLFHASVSFGNIHTRVFLLLLLSPRIYLRSIG